MRSAERGAQGRDIWQERKVHDVCFDKDEESHSIDVIFIFDSYQH